MKTINSKYYLPTGIATVLVIALIIFFPGLSGPLLLDDIPNLYRLSFFNQDPNYDLFKYYQELFEQGKYARPLSFLTFAAQYKSWPLGIFNFKLVNLIIHFINALLIAILTYQLANFFFPNNTSASQKTWFILISTFLWVIHPIQHSSVFYVVQRMTLLSSFFMLIGMNYYLYTRTKKNFLSTFKEFIIFFSFMGLILVLAIISKGNGLLLCLYILLIEYMYGIKNNEKPKWLKRFLIIYTLIPLLLFSIYMLNKWEMLSHLGEIRGFSPIERLMTETRILFDYGAYILFPDIFNGGLFHDNIKVSKSLFSPISTIACVAGIIAILLFTYIKRRSYPILFFIPIWFLISHLIESTIIPLELYFEHRNYLASICLIWGILYLFFFSRTHFPKISLYTLVIYLSIIILLGYQSAKIWSSEENIVINWAIPKNNSARSYFFIAEFWQKRGRIDKVIETYDKAAKNLDNNMFIRMSQLIHRCQGKSDTEMLITKLIKDIPQLQSTITVNTLVHPLFKQFKQGNCHSLNREYMLKIMSELINHKAHDKPSILTDFYYISAKVEALSGNYNRALLLMDKSYELFPKVNVALIQAQWLASSKMYPIALIYVKKAAKLANKKGLNVEDTQILTIRKSIIKLMDNNIVPEDAND